MISSPPNISPREAARLAALSEYDLLDTRAETSFDQLVAVAAEAFNVPIATITLIDGERQWFKARVGLPQSETPRNVSFCTYTIEQLAPLVVADATQDPRFAANPFVTGEPHLRFYAGVPLINPQGHALGALCVADRRTREVTVAQLQLLQRLGTLAMELIEQRRLVRRLRVEEAGRLRATMELDHLLEETENSRRAIAASEQRYRLLFECHPQPLWVYDADTLRFLAVNEAAIRHYGWSRREFLAMTIKDIRPPAEVPGMLKSVAKASSRIKVTCSGEWTHQRKDGTQIRVEISSHELLYDDRKARLVLACDVTEKRSLQDQFLRAQRMENLGLLAAGIAHDLNNILTPMMMIAPLLGRRLTTESDQRLLVTVEQSVRRGAGLVKQITSFAKGSGNELGAVQVKYLARDVAAIVAETFPRSIHFNPDIASSLWAARANPTQVHQVILNLCVNARDAMPDGGQLTLRVANRTIDALTAASLPNGRPGNFVVIEVADTGTGIAPEVAERIWEPFFTTKEEGKGTGLGLATVRGIVARHHGFITLDTKVGHGSTFAVYLPSDEDAGPGDGSRTETAAGAPADATTDSGAGECILFVDDEADIRTFAHAALSQHGYRPLLARDAEQAITLFQEHRDDIRLVITDHHMPGMYGDELIAALRHLRPGLPVLLCSGSSGRRWPGIVQEEMLLKPFEPVTLLAAIGQLLRN